MEERRRSTGDAATFDVEWGITEDGVCKATPVRRLTHYCMNSIVLEEGGESLITKAGSYAAYVPALELPQLWRPASRTWDRWASSDVWRCGAMVAKASHGD